jgi:two-component system chemotaxis response regulator CheY
MVVDDSPIIRRGLREILETMGHKVVAEAEDGKEAVEVYKRHKIDLVTMDIHLPGIDGIEAVRHIRGYNPNALIVMISSIEHRNKVYEAIKLGAKHYIVKPYTDMKVMEVIRAVLGTGVNPAPPAEPAVQPESEPQPEQAAQTKPGRFDKKQPERLELDAPALSSLPYELIMKDGKIVMTLQRHISDMNLRYFYNALQGLLYFRKAKIVLELWEPVASDEGIRLLTEFVAIVRSRKGTVAVVSDDIGQFAKLKAALKDGVYRSYGEITW